MLRIASTQLLILVALGSPLTIASAQAGAAASTNPAKVRAAIEAANARYIDMFNKGDVAGFAKVYDDDAAVLAPNMETARAVGDRELVAGGLECRASEREADDG